MLLDYDHIQSPDNFRYQQTDLIAIVIQNIFRRPRKYCCRCMRKNAQLAAIFFITCAFHIAPSCR